MADSRIITWTEKTAFDGTESLAVDDGSNKKMLTTHTIAPVASSTVDSNYALNAAHNSIDSLVYSSIISTPGTIDTPNAIGTGTKPVDGPAGWTDKPYTPGHAIIGTIAGGYDHVMSQIAGTISGGGHNYMPQSNNGHSIITGGSRNYNGGGYCNITGGTQNTVGDNADFSNISGGTDNVIAGGNYASNVHGGANNEITGASSAQTIDGGTNNIISAEAGGNSILGGNDNLISGFSNDCVVLASDGSSASGDNTIVAGLNCSSTASHSATIGSGCTNSKHYSLAFGLQVSNDIAGALVHSGRSNGAVGDAQSVQFAMSEVVSSGALAYLSSEGTTTYADIPNNTAWSGEVYLSGIVTTAGTGAAVGDTVAYKIPFQCKNISGTGSRQLGGQVDAVLLVDEIGIVGPPEVNIHAVGVLRVGVYSHVDAVVSWCARVQLTSVTL